MSRNNIAFLSAALECANKSKGASRLVFLQLARWLMGDNPAVMELDSSRKPEFSLAHRLDKDIAKLEEELRSKGGS